MVKAKPQTDGQYQQDTWNSHGQAQNPILGFLGLIVVFFAKWFPCSLSRQPFYACVTRKMSQPQAILHPGCNKRC